MKGLEFHYTHVHIPVFLSKVNIPQKKYTFHNNNVSVLSLSSLLFTLRRTVGCVLRQ